MLRPDRVDATDLAWALMWSRIESNRLRDSTPTEWYRHFAQMYASVRCAE